MNTDKNICTFDDFNEKEQWLPETLFNDGKEELKYLQGKNVLFSLYSNNRSV
jgi:hypothetical protein